MKILIVEDDQNKVKKLEEFIRGGCPTCEITVRNSFQSGLKEIISNHFDCLILDMAMPTFDKTPVEKGGRLRMYAGSDLLRQMERRIIKIPSIIVTQYEVFGEDENKKTLKQLGEELQRAYPHMYRGIIYYNAALSNWKLELQKALEKIKNR